MNMNEDKFANKSAEEIISDMLTQHKNNSKEALEHIQDILNDDGLTLSKDVKDNLQKAATILSDKGLKEGWFSKPKPKESVVFEVYLPFKKEPAQFQIPPVSSLDDPLVTETIEKIRKKHPHSTIYIRSKLGYKRITEEKKNSDESLFAKMAKGILNSDLTKNIAATALGTFTGISPAFTKPVTNSMLSATGKKFESTSSYKVNLYNESGDKYSCYAGNLPIALALVEKANNYTKADVLYNENIVCSYNHSLKEWTVNTNENTLKEDIYTSDDVTNHAYVDLRKDITDIDERIKVTLCHLNPNLIDKRKPKFHNVLDSVKTAPIENSVDGKEEILVVLNGVENEVNKENPDKTEVLITEKIPYRYTEKGILYKDGDSYPITVAQFKKILNAEENAETVEKFENSKGPVILDDTQAGEFLQLDTIAKQIIDAKYPDWENEHWDTYNLGIYDVPERAKIYQAWKDTNRTNMYQKARELTPEEVAKQFGLPKLKQVLANQKVGDKLMTAFNSVKRSLPETEQAKLDEDLLNLITSADTVEDTEIAKIIGLHGAKNQLNQLSKNKLIEIENGLDSTKKEKFENELNDLIENKYIDLKSGLPTVVKQVSNATKDINDIINKYSSSTEKSKWRNMMNNDKEIKPVVNAIIEEINTLGETNQKVAKVLRSKLTSNLAEWEKEKIVGKDLIDNLKYFLKETRVFVSDFMEKYNNTKADYDKAQANIPVSAMSTSDLNELQSKLDELQSKLDKLNNISYSDIKFSKEKDHDNWLDMVKHIENPKSKSETDRSYWTAITNKISRLVKTDPQAAEGYGNAFRALIKDLETKQVPEKEIELQLAKFLDTLKNETGGFGTISKALASVI